MKFIFQFRLEVFITAMLGGHSPPDSACLLMRACIYLKIKQTEAVNKNNKNLN